MESSSTEVGKFPLKYLLVLYITANKQDVYCDYFKGFKLLAQWLSPIGIPEIENETRLPTIFVTYEIQEISKYLNCSPEVVYQTLREIYYGRQTETTELQLPDIVTSLSKEVPTHQA